MRRTTRLIGLLVVSVALHAAVLAALPDDGALVEAAYAERLYPLIAPVVAFLPSLLPFSLINVVFVLLAVGLPVYAVANAIRWRRNRLPGRDALERSLLACAAAGALLFHTFYLFWGYNYFRVPLERRLALEPAAITREPHIAFSRRFVAAAVAERVAIAAWDRAELDALVDAAVAEAVWLLEARPPPVTSPLKGDLGSGVLGLLATRGFVFGTTLEVHVDFGLPAFILPFTAAHEKAHLAGYARERDANFLAWLALTRADDPRLRYAGYFGVIAPFINSETRPLAGPVLADRAELAAYTASRIRAPALQRTGQRVYSSYLRANRMPDGIGDYAQVWQLIQAWASERGGLAP